MAHGLNSVLKRGIGAVQCKPEGKTGVGSRRIFSPQFKLQVLDSYRNDSDCKGNQRATARKYGIHRRQIQKWLQAENTLRSGVGGKHQLTQTVKSEMSLSGHRQRDDETSALRSASLASEARVPALEPPAGWRLHHQAPLCVSDPVAPMDLSLKRPVPAPLSSPPALYLPTVGPSPCLSSNQPDVWDLSTKSNKRKAEDNGASTTSPKPVKLFKPYLDDLRDGDNKSPCDATSPQITPSSPQSAYCCQPPLTCSPEVYYINNNNNNNNLCCDIMKSPEYHPAYSLHELQPKISYYHYPYYPDLSPPYHPYEDPALIQARPLKPAFSLDFKLSAIDSYYQDSLCKGNPRAVVQRYQIHRRESPKWLNDEEELKSRSEILKEPHAVR